MSLKLAMLGFIDMMPMSGYDLKKYFDSSVQFYWAATHSQIYRTLREMEQEDLLTVEIINQTDFPNKKVYQITDKGKQTLAKWVMQSPELPPIRHKLLVQLSWSDRLKTEDIIKLLETYAKQIQNRLDIYNSAQQTSIAELGRTKRERLLWRALQDNGITAYNAELDWARRTIEKLKKH